MKTTNYLLQTTNLPNKSQKPTNYQLSTKLINFKTHQIQQILFLLLSSICHSVIDFSTGCCMLYALRHLYAKKNICVFFVYHSTFYILYSVLLFCCPLSVVVWLCSLFNFLALLSGMWKSTKWIVGNPGVRSASLQPVKEQRNEAHEQGEHVSTLHA